MEDVDMVEVDELPAGRRVFAVNKSPQADRSKASGTTHVPRREILRAKRKLKDLSKLRTVLVLDTNIVINHCEELKQLILDACELDVTFVIPLIVIQELDILKHKKEVDQSHITLIHQFLKMESNVLSDKNLFKLWPQNKVREAFSSSSDLTEMNNDDKILRASLVTKDLLRDYNSSIFLITDDVNLSTKAMATDLDYLNWKSLRSLWSTLTKKQSSGLESISGQALSSPVSKKTSCRPKIVTRDESESMPVDFAESVDNNHGKMSSIELSAKNSQELQQISKNLLVNLIKNILKQTYQDLWNSVYKVNFDNCNLLDALVLLKRGWIGIFSDAFKRNTAVQDLSASLIKDLRDKKKKDIDCERLIELIQYVQDAEKNNHYLHEPSERLKRVRKSERKRRCPRESTEEPKKMHIDPIRIYI